MLASPTSAPGSTACRSPSSWRQLAPARCRSTQISSRLNDRFRLLTGGSRTALPRQQTLAAVVDWSYDLLFDAEQRVFERLSVFPGGCDLATAEAVCADDTIAAEDIADLVQALVDKSLVVAQSESATPFASRSCRRCRSTATRSSPRAATRSERAMRWPRTSRGSARRARLRSRVRRSVRGCAPSTVEHDNLRAALEWAHRERRRRDRAGDRGRRELVTLAHGHRRRGRTLARRRVRVCRSRDGPDTRAGARGPRVAPVDRRCLRRSRRRPTRGTRDVPPSRRPSRCHLHPQLLLRDRRATGRLEEARARRLEALDVYLALPDDEFVVAVRAYSRAILAMIDGDLTERGAALPASPPTGSAAPTVP